ncbi:MAG: phosphoribosylformylglycinamidine synthase I [Bacteroidetes bacterium]|nr:MAG: phosphoribosylformylglycinamidine synthase I [Bacteroidota bacterium]
MTTGIMIFPGAHGDKELTRVLEQVYNLKVRPVWNGETSLEGIDLLFIPGGFPCKASSAGTMCIEQSPVIDAILEYAEKGKVLVGIGNGFRLLCDTDLLPGSLRMNRSRRYICRSVFVKPDNDQTLLTLKLSCDRACQLPIATGYGRYAARDEVLVDLRYQDQILFRFCDGFGRISEENNVTGSVDNIAGLCNARKNVFGIVPQPERAVFTNGRGGDGRLIFDSLLNHL